MEYNFSSVSVEAITALEKRLNKIKDDVLADIGNFIYVLNDQQIIEKIGELNAVIGDIINDHNKQATIDMTACMGKVQKVLKQYL